MSHQSLASSIPNKICDYSRGAAARKAGVLRPQNTSGGGLFVGDPGTANHVLGHYGSTMQKGAAALPITLPSGERNLLTMHASTSIVFPMMIMT